MILQSIREAFDMLRMNKLRAFLTMLGVIIGVMSVSLITLISGGFQSYLSTQFEKLGTDTMFVFFDGGRRDRGQTTGGKDKLTNDDLTYLMQTVPDLEVGSGFMGVQSQVVKAGEKELKDPSIFAIDENYLELNRFNIIRGRALNGGDLKLRSNVCIIGTAVTERLFGKEDPIGKLVQLPGIALEVVGVIEKADYQGSTTEKHVYLPLTTAQDKYVGGNRLDMLMLRAKKGVTVDQAMDKVWVALMARSDNKPIYRLDSRESILKIFSGIFGAAGIVLAAVATLSLLVGGIGIMNIMLVSVTERTKEIGLRKAVGAQQNAIILQFLVESAVLSLVGGLIGMSIAYGLGQVVQFITISTNFPGPGGLSTPFPLTSAIGALLFSALIGIVFGLYPAIKASALDPIVALRRE